MVWRVLILLFFLASFTSHAQTLAQQIAKAEQYYEKGANYLALNTLENVNKQELHSHPSLALNYYALASEINYSILSTDKMLKLIKQHKLICDTYFKNQKIYHALNAALFCRYYNYKAVGDSLSFYALESKRLLKEAKVDTKKYAKEISYIYMCYGNARRNSGILTAPNFAPDVAAQILDTAIAFCKSVNNYSPFYLAKIRQVKACALLDLTTEGIQKKLGRNFSYQMYKKSCMELNEAIRLYSLVNKNHPQIATCKALIGLEAQYLQEYDKALNHYNEAEKRCTIKGVPYALNTLNNYANVLKWQEWCYVKIHNDSSKTNLIQRINNINKATINWKLILFESTSMDSKSFSDVYSINPESLISEYYYKLYKLTNNKRYLDTTYLHAEKQKHYAIQEKQAGINYNSDLYKKIANKWHLQIDSFIIGETNKCVLNKKELHLMDSLINAANRFKKTSLTSIQKSLTNKNEAAIYYFMNSTLMDSKLLAICITSDSIFSITFPTKLAGYNAQGLEFAYNKALEGYDLKLVKHNGYLMYQHFIEPALSKLPAHINKLILFPSTFMEGYTFNSFLTDTLGNSFKNLNYLVNKYSILYQLSGYTYLSSINSTSTKNYPLYLWQNQYEASHLNPLNANDNLITYLSNTYNSHLYLSNTNNNEQDFYKIIQEAPVFHFSGHANAKSDLSSFSHLYLHKDTISMADFYKLNLSANQLCVLNGCNTGIGLIIYTEGQNDFARALTSQGSKALVLNKKPADDKASAFILKQFYKLMQEGYTKSEAMAQAQRNYIKQASIQNANPLLWNSLFVLGNNQPIYLQENNNDILLIIISGICLLLLLFLLRKRLPKFFSS